MIHGEGLEESGNGKVSLSKVVFVIVFLFYQKSRDGKKKGRPKTIIICARNI
jgi:hypothetical protein